MEPGAEFKASASCLALKKTLFDDIYRANKPITIKGRPEGNNNTVTSLERDFLPIRILQGRP